MQIDHLDVSIGEGDKERRFADEAGKQIESNRVAGGTAAQSVGDLAAQAGVRLWHERVRLGLSRLQVATAVGVTRAVQRRYEAGTNEICAPYLGAIARLGFDVEFVVAGSAGSEASCDRPLDRRERALIKRYRRLPGGGRKLLEAIAIFVSGRED